ncbi:MAG: HAD hydrolase-like protein [Pseudomonadota bacterium]
MKRTLIFDFDGVVADTREMLFSIFSEHDPTMSSEDFSAHFDGNVHQEPRVKFTPRSLARMHDEYCRRIDQKHVEAAINPIERLTSEHRLFIVSSGEERGINNVLQQAGVRRCFEAIYGHNTHQSKVAKFEKLRDQFGVSLTQSVFITDTLGDIREAQKVGLKTIAVTFGFHDRARLMRSRPNAIVDSWNEVESALEQQITQAGQKGRTD